MDSLPIRKILDRQRINYSIKYDTMIIYGNLELKGIQEDISFPHEHLWVRGSVEIENCPLLKNLPSDVIEANRIEIKNCNSISTWPKKLYADDVVLLENSGRASLFNTEIYSDSLLSDHPAHTQNNLNIYGYSVRNNEDDKFLALVSDLDGNVLWRLDATNAMTLHEMGYLKDIRSSAEVGSYLREIGVLDSNSKLFPIQDARNIWSSIEKSSAKSPVFFSLSE